MFHFKDVFGFNLGDEIVRFEKGINEVSKEIQNHHFFKELLDSGFVVPASEMPAAPQDKGTAELQATIAELELKAEADAAIISEQTAQIAELTKPVEDEAATEDEQPKKGKK